MTFELINAGATYQRMLQSLLHGMIHRAVEVYAYDMIIKSKSFEQQVYAFRKFFKISLKLQHTLKPKKVYLWGHLRKAFKI